jgi:hypothetical protein
MFVNLLTTASDVTSSLQPLEIMAHSTCNFFAIHSVALKKKTRERESDTNVNLANYTNLLDNLAMNSLSSRSRLSPILTNESGRRTPLCKKGVE